MRGRGARRAQPHAPLSLRRERRRCCAFRPQARQAQPLAMLRHVSANYCSVPPASAVNFPDPPRHVRRRFDLTEPVEKERFLFFSADFPSRVLGAYARDNVIPASFARESALANWFLCLVRPRIEEAAGEPLQSAVHTLFSDQPPPEILIRRSSFHFSMAVQVGSIIGSQ